MNTAQPPRPPRQRRPKPVKQRPPEENEDTPWRLFLAVPLPDAVREHMATIVEQLQPHGWPVRWVDPDNGHLTLHFIGDTPPEDAALMRMALPHVLAGHEAFDLRTADLGAFPNIRKPRVLWVGLWGPAHRLEAIYNDLGDFLADFGVDLEEKPFAPHITLGRLRQGHGVPMGDLVADIRRVFDDLAATGGVSHDHPVPMPVTEVQLIRSHLGPDGARYEVLASIPLDTPTPD